MTGSIRDYTKYLNLPLPEFDVNTWHDYIYQCFKTLDASIGNLYTVENFKGVWKNSNLYTVGEKVIDTESYLIYEVVIEHTSSATLTFAEFRLANPTYYSIYDSVELSKSWAIKMTGKVNDEDFSSKAWAIGTILECTEGSSKYYRDLCVTLKNEIDIINNNVNQKNTNVNEKEANVVVKYNEILGFKTACENYSLNCNQQSTYCDEKAISANNSAVNAANSATSAQNSVDTIETAIANKTDKSYVDEQDDLKLNKDLSNLDYIGRDAMLPVGAVIGLVRSSAPTNSRLILCNGATLSRSIYTKLFEAIGTTFGVGDGSTTFALPDYRGKFLRGLGGNSAGDFITTQNEGLPNITGTTVSFQRGNTGAFSGALYYVTGSTMNVGAGNGACSIAQVGIDASLSSSIYGASTHVTPINQALNYFIRY